MQNTELKILHKIINEPQNISIIRLLLIMTSGACAGLDKNM